MCRGAKQFPFEIGLPATDQGTDSHIWLPGDALRKTINRAGFTINPNKTHLMYWTSRQRVTGLVVNKKINIRWEYRHNVRAMVNKLVNTGEFELNGIVHKDGKVAIEKRRGSLNELHGMLGFVNDIDVYNNLQTNDKPHGFSSTERVYRKFLIYSIFYAAQMPVILCEGDTDNVYITHAIRSLAREFPDLADVRADGKIVLKVRLYKYPNSSTSRLLGLGHGGSSVLSKFISGYKKEISSFKAPGLAHPVIIVYDNDEGAQSIRGTIKQITKTTPKKTNPFDYVTNNMYAVPTPIPEGEEASKIEDFFDETIKSTVVTGKIFNDGNNIDANQHYGKKVFAHKVVRPKAQTIDFSGFRPLLSNIVEVIKDHKAKFVMPAQ